MIREQALFFRELPCDDDDAAITEVGHGTSFKQTSRLEAVVPSIDAAAYGQVRYRHDVYIPKANRHCVVHGALLLGVRAEHTWEEEAPSVVALRGCERARSDTLCRCRQRVNTRGEVSLSPTGEHPRRRAEGFTVTGRL
jgi:hypothetical protein